MEPYTYAYAASYGAYLLLVLVVCAGSVAGVLSPPDYKIKSKTVKHLLLLYEMVTFAMWTAAIVTTDDHKASMFALAATLCLILWICVFLCLPASPALTITITTLTIASSLLFVLASGALMHHRRYIGLILPYFLLRALIDPMWLIYYLGCCNTCTDDENPNNHSLAAQGSNIYNE